MKIISVHAPKAGGTSILKALSNAFGDKFEADNSDDPADPRSQRNIDPDSYFSRRRTLRHGIRCLHGHFHPGQFDLAGAYLFTLLRHPVENIISIYYFWKELPPQGQPLHDYFLSRELDIFEMASLPLLKRLYSQTYFGSFDMSRFDLIGRHDRRGEALRKLGTDTGAPIDASLRVNVTRPSPEREALMADSTAIRRLGAILQDDIRFYELYCG